MTAPVPAPAAAPGPRAAAYAAARATGVRWARAAEDLTLRPLSLYGSAVLRIGYGLTYLAFLVREFPHREALWGPAAAWTPAMAHQYAGYQDWYGWIRSWYTLLATTNDTRFELSYAAALLICGAMAAGYRTRATSVAFMLVVTTFSARDPYLGDGGDNVLVLMSLYLVFLASGRRLSMDARRARRAPARAAAPATGLAAELGEVRRRLVTMTHNAAVLVVGCQMCVIYGAAALWKAQGSTWQDGTALYYTLHVDWFRVWPGLSDLVASNGIGVALVAYLTVFVQLGFPFAVFSKRLKYVVLVLLLGMHLGIAVLMGLPVFSAAMIIGDSVFLPDTFWLALGRSARRVRAALSRRRGSGAEPAPAPEPAPRAPQEASSAA